MTLRDTEPCMPVADDDAITLRMIEAALAIVECERDSDHAIAVCAAPESVGRSRSEIPAAPVAVENSDDFGRLDFDVDMGDVA